MRKSSSILPLLFILLSLINFARDVSAFSHILFNIPSIRTSSITTSKGTVSRDQKMVLHHYDHYNNKGFYDCNIAPSLRQGISSSSFPSKYQFHRQKKNNLSKLFGRPNLHENVENKRQPNKRRGLRTRLNMVLTTPESIIEQISTQKLLDELIDESVRTNARKPIMMQFDPSSGWVSFKLLSEKQKLNHPILKKKTTQFQSKPFLYYLMNSSNSLWSFFVGGGIYYFIFWNKRFGEGGKEQYLRKHRHHVCGI